MDLGQPATASSPWDGAKIDANHDARRHRVLAGRVTETDGGGDDPVAAVARTVRRWAAERQLPCIPGQVTAEGALPLVLIHHRNGPSVDQVLGWLEACGATLLAIRESALTRDQWQDLQDRCARREVHRELQRELRNLEDVIGHLGGVRVTALIGRPPALVVYDHWAAWYYIVAEADEVEPVPTDPEALAELDAYEERMAERARWTPAAIESAARRLIDDERWPQARKEDAQLYLADQILGADMPGAHAIQLLIVRRAKTLFEFERPTKRGAKRRQ